METNEEENGNKMRPVAKTENHNQQSTVIKHRGSNCIHSLTTNWRLPSLDMLLKSVIQVLITLLIGVTGGWSLVAIRISMTESGSICFR